MLASGLRDGIRWLPLDEGRTSSAWAAYRHAVRRDLHPARQAMRARTLLGALRDIGPGDASRIFASGDAALLTGLWWEQATGAAPRPPDVIFHGELTELTGWRSRRPTWRGLDLTAALRRWFRRGGSITVLEPHVEEALGERFPGLVRAGSVKVLPHPTTQAEHADGTGSTDGPLQVGFLGIATRAKGFDAFVEVADRLRDEPGVRFRVAGFRGEGLPDLPLDALADPLPATGLPRAEFERVVAELDYVCLPLSGDYYRFAASGTVLDAIRYLKPILALDTPLARRLFESAGDIGHLCADGAALETTIRELASAHDDARRRRQVENLRRLRERRSPAALAEVAAEIWALGD